MAARLADSEVRAPLDGVVLARDVEPGEVVAINQPLLRIGDIDRLILECSVDEADVGKIVAGNKAAVAVYAFPQRVFRGTVTEVMPDADRLKKSFLVKVRLDQPPPGLRSGMSAEVNIVVEEHPGVVLAPVDSVDAAGSAWVVVDGRAQRRVVRVGMHDLAHMEILSGVAAGEQVVVAGADALKDAARVAAKTRPYEAGRSRLTEGGP
jgi:RND family efflux transporter MFP subunit